MFAYRRLSSRKQAKKETLTGTGPKLPTFPSLYNTLDKEYLSSDEYTSNISPHGPEAEAGADSGADSVADTDSDQSRYSPQIKPSPILDYHYTGGSKKSRSSVANSSVQRSPDKLELTEPVLGARSVDTSLSTSHKIVDQLAIEQSLHELLESEYSFPYIEYCQMVRHHMDLVYVQARYLCRNNLRGDIIQLIKSLHPLVSPQRAIFQLNNRIQRFDSVCALIGRLVLMDRDDTDVGEETETTIYAYLGHVIEQILFPPLLSFLHAITAGSLSYIPIALCAISNIVAETRRPRALLQHIVNQRLVYKKDPSWQTAESLALRLMRAEVLAALAHVCVKLRDISVFNDCLVEVQASIIDDTSLSVRNRYRTVFEAFGDRYIVTTRELASGLGIRSGGDHLGPEWIQAKHNVQLVLEGLK